MSSNSPHTIRRLRPNRRARRWGALFSVELIIVLIILFAVLVGTVQFGILLMASQGVSAAANIGAREAALPSSTGPTVAASVNTALQGWVWQGYHETVIFVNNVKDDGTPAGALANAVTGDLISVSVNVPMIDAAPNALKVLGIDLAGKDLTATYVMRRE